jgi:hypothetical protein
MVDYDKYGVLKIFPDLKGGVSLFQDGGQFSESYTRHGYANSYFDSDRNGRNRNYCRISIPPGVEAWRKTFAFTSSGSKLLQPNQEVTIYIYLPNLTLEYGSDPLVKCKLGSGHDIKLRGAFHSNTSNKSAHCYIFHYEYEGGECNNFQKEYPHPTYSRNTIAEDNILPSWIGKVMGFKSICINTEDNKNVEFWSYFDASGRFDGNGNIVINNDWKLRYHGIDTGQYGIDNTKPPFTTTWGKYTEFRMDNAANATKAFYGSLREIQRP